MTLLTRRFHIIVSCPSCSVSMHVDSHKLDSPTRIVICENAVCEEYGFAWTLDALTGVGTSERKEIAI